MQKKKANKITKRYEYYKILDKYYSKIKANRTLYNNYVACIIYFTKKYALEYYKVLDKKVLFEV